MSANLTLKKDSMEFLVFSVFFFIIALAAKSLLFRKAYLTITNEYISQRFSKIQWDEIHSAMEIKIGTLHAIYLSRGPGQRGFCLQLWTLNKRDAEEVLSIILRHAPRPLVKNYTDIDFSAYKRPVDIGHEYHNSRITEEALETGTMTIKWDSIKKIYLDIIRMALIVQWGSVSQTSIKLKPDLKAMRFVRAVASRLAPMIELDQRVADLALAKTWPKMDSSPGLLNTGLLIAAPVATLYSIHIIYGLSNSWGVSYGYILLPFIFSGLPWATALLTMEYRQQELIGLTPPQVAGRIRRLALISIGGTAFSVAASFLIHEALVLTRMLMDL